MTRQGRARQAGLSELPALPCTGEVFTVTLAVVLSMPMATFRIRPLAPVWNQVWIATGGSVAGLGPLPSVHLTPRISSESILSPCMNVCVFHACDDSAAPHTHYSHGQFRSTPSLRSTHTHSQVYTRLRSAAPHTHYSHGQFRSTPILRSTHTLTFIPALMSTHTSTPALRLTPVVAPAASGLLLFPHCPFVYSTQAPFPTPRPPPPLCRYLDRAQCTHVSPWTHLGWLLSWGLPASPCQPQSRPSLLCS